MMLLNEGRVILLIIHYLRAVTGMSGQISQHLTDDKAPKMFNRSRRLGNVDAVMIVVGQLFSGSVSESSTGDNL